MILRWPQHFDVIRNIFRPVPIAIVDCILIYNPIKKSVVVSIHQCMAEMLRGGDRQHNCGRMRALACLGVVSFISLGLVLLI